MYNHVKININKNIFSESYCVYTNNIAFLYNFLNKNMTNLNTYKKHVFYSKKKITMKAIYSH